MPEQRARRGLDIGLAHQRFADQEAADAVFGHRVEIGAASSRPLSATKVQSVGRLADEFVGARRNRPRSRAGRGC